MIAEIALALEQARYPERFTRDGQRLELKATSYRPARAASWQQRARAPHPDEETRLAAVLSVLVKLREAELEIIKAATEIAEAMKGNR